MHESPDLGVVDANLKCHAVDNLYAVGGSAFPTAGFSNPTLTIVALAVRLARTLKERL
jgi:choline dehydrogenase-like flavoprotein